MGSTVARIKRDCCCTRARHQHGTARAYVADRCRCVPCTRTFARVQKAKRHRQHLQIVPFVSPVGTARRLQALAVLGWSADDLAPLLHTRAPDVIVWRLGKRSTVTAKVAARVVAVYDQVWNQPPPGRYATKVRNLAARRGWAPPLAWDDDEIDDPAATPFISTGHEPYELLPCGTEAAAKRHWRRGEPLDRACLAAAACARARRRSQRDAA